MVLSHCYTWLNDRLGVGFFASHSATSTGVNAVAFYFRDVENARTFLEAHPMLELADGTASIAYSSPNHDGAWQSEDFLGVCNLYSMTTSQAAITDLIKVWKDSTGNLPVLTGIYPDYSAPVIRNTDQGRQLVNMRWGMPSPAFALKNRNADSGITNIRNTSSPYWRRWLSVQHRCLVPFNSFSEYEKKTGQPAAPIWFALNETRPLAFFAGIWTSWTSVRKVKEGETTNDLFGFLTTDANGVVAPIHPKAMPVILNHPDQWETWLNAPPDAALALQKPLPDDALQIVATGKPSDGTTSK
ncbi:SOS response-associated peptidase [Roseovarius sp. Pro17]|uniref:SOS response-associated peptidase n=1 Tax=Roseovarius sp. Pro17 TaxID=3108175 RepID=UPI002D77C382|nr:SOS response-associated peptidase [Roseovarius sp. Pro17]